MKRLKELLHIVEAKKPRPYFGTSDSMSMAVQLNSLSDNDISRFKDVHAFVKDRGVENDVFTIKHPNLVKSKKLQYAWTPKQKKIIKDLAGAGGSVEGNLKHIFNLLKRSGSI